MLAEGKIFLQKKSYAEAEAELNKFYLACTNASEKKFALSMLVGHFRYIAEDTKALRLLQKAVKIYPDDVEFRLSLAEHFHYYEINLPTALKHIEKALELAILNNIFIRQVIITKIRILLKMKNYSGAKESLLMLILYKPSEKYLDVALEDDFLDKFPENFIDLKIIEKYKSLSRKFV